MRRITALGIISTASWIAPGSLLLHMHLAGPDKLTAMWYLAALAAAVTTTLAARLSPRRDQPIGISYDLGWQQGYRTAEAKYLALATQLKGQFRGKDQSPPEG